MKSLIRKISRLFLSPEAREAERRREVRRRAGKKSWETRRRNQSPLKDAGDEWTNNDVAAARVLFPDGIKGIEDGEGAE